MEDYIRILEFVEDEIEELQEEQKIANTLEYQNIAARLEAYYTVLGFMRNM